MKREHQKQIFVSVAILFGFVFAIPNVAQQSQSPSPNSVTSPTKNTSPATKTSPKQVNPNSKTAPPTNSPSPSSTQQNSPSQKNSNFWDNFIYDLIKKPNVVLAALITTIFGTIGFGFYQLRQNSKLQKELEQQKRFNR